MTSLASAFRSGSSGGWAHSLSTPHYAPIKVAKHKKQHGNIITHFVGDVRDAAVGIPMGLVKTAEALGKATTGNYHPLEKMGSSIWHSYGYMYGPAFHGHLGTTLHRMGQHPLQPLLDAISIVTAPVAGIGVAVKGADVAAQMGARIGMVSAERAAQATRAASFFRPRGRYVHEALGHPGGWDVLSANPSLRGVKRLREGTEILLSKALPKTFGEGKLIDLSRPGIDTRIQMRHLKTKRGEREHASSALFAREMKFAKNFFKNPNVSAHDIAYGLEKHMRAISVAHAFGVKETELGSKGKLADGWAFLDKTHRYSEFPRDKSVAEFHRWLTGEGKGSKGFGESMLTQTAKSAMRDKDGNYLVVRTRSIKDIQEEAARTHKAVRILFDNPTKVWKWAVLATAPRYFVNNVVGNGIMYGMAANPIDTTRAMFLSIRQMHGNRQALKSLHEVEQAQVAIIGDWVDKWYSAATEGFGHEVTRDMKLHERYKNPALRGTVRTLEGGLFKVTQFASDTIPRRALVNLFIRKESKYQKEYRTLRTQGVNRKTAHQQAADHASSYGDVRASVVKQVDNVMGQYHTFNRTEKAVKRLIPFYSWDRAIARHAYHLAAEKPVAAGVIAQLGYQGTEETKKILGDVPDFMKGVIPLERIGIHGGGVLGFLVGDHGRDSVLSTQGLNPYASVPDVLNFASTLVTGNPKAGEALAGQLNPILTGFIEHYTGQSLLSGRTKDTDKGLFHDLAQSVAEGTPTVRMLETLARGRPHPKLDDKGRIKSPLLYKGDFKQQGLSFLGVPVKEVSKSKAAELFRREHGITLPTHRTTAYKPVNLKGFSSKKHRSSIGRVRTKPSLRLPRPKKLTF